MYRDGIFKLSLKARWNKLLSPKFYCVFKGRLIKVRQLNFYRVHLPVRYV